ncbi:MAG: hypothetical protein FRX48_06542 [Lasallia pustulata]|uniref:Uncharacterized protein n=1 Tax=Lasallia pustulata TaxID=136370 RepID=A0A5M8PKF4_9LECA|nr:MAG: hypothetical protein FRX48_06542 [Lasallia pustulata]
MSFPYPPPNPPPQPPEQISLQRAVARPFPPLLPLPTNAPISREERLDAMITNLQRHHREVKTHLLQQTLHALRHLPPPTPNPRLPPPPTPKTPPSSTCKPPTTTTRTRARPRTRPATPRALLPSTRALPAQPPPHHQPQTPTVVSVVSDAAKKMAAYERLAARTEAFYERARERMRDEAGNAGAGLVDKTRDPRLRR